MAKVQIYEITVNKFYKHNPKTRKSFTHFMVAKNYFNDSKIVQLTPNESQLFLYCCSIACDMGSNQFTITSQSLPKHFRISCKSLHNHLTRLEQFQLLTVTKIDPLIKRIEVKGIEEKRREVTSIGEKKIKHETTPVWEAYKKAYQERYHVEPIRNAKTNGIISKLVSRVGHEEAVLLVQFYLYHNNHYYIKKMHDLGACLSDAEGLVTQRLRGKAITDKEVREFSQHEANMELLEASRKGGF